VDYLGCGGYYKRSSKDSGCFIVQKFSDFTEKILPFLGKYPILGVKALDFEDFRQAADIIKAKGHITPEGLEKLLIIKAGMNKGRRV